MAALNADPVPNLPAGIARLERDLPDVLAGRTLEQAGWVQPTRSSLCIPTWSKTFDFFLLRLTFECYPEWPPSALFVNPITKIYEGKDIMWLPKIEAPHLKTHANYADRHGQVICNSSTLEFYKVGHGLGDAGHIWNESYTFQHTLHTITDALRSSFYLGRMG